MVMNLKVKGAVSALILASGIAGSVAGGPFEDGVNAAKAGDYATAMRLWRPLADQGYAWAQSNLGLMYAKGQGVPQDHVSAHMWFNLAAAGGNIGAARYRDIVTKNMSPAQIAEAQRLAREWKPSTPCVALTVP
jgi:TPR repeat protein